MHDPLVCPVCEELDAMAEWTFTGEEGVPDSLEWGGRVVWTKTQGSAVHGHHKKERCRCHLENPDFDVSDIQKRLEEILADAKAARGIDQPSV